MDACCYPLGPEIVSGIRNNLKSAIANSKNDTVRVASICTGWGVGDMGIDSINDVLGNDGPKAWMSWVMRFDFRRN